MADSTSPPVVLVFAGHDPSGGAGIQADIETLGALGCHAAPVVTAITVQDSRNVYSCTSLATSLVADQARAVFDDMAVGAIKIGLLGNAAIAETIVQLLLEYPAIPVVLDPILTAGGGHPLASTDVREQILHSLAPLTTLVTPNTVEARILAGDGDDADAWAGRLLARGFLYVLITGTHEPDAPGVTNRLYSEATTGCLRSDTWERLPHEYHGSGCTLASAIAAGMAQGHDVPGAVEAGQRFTWLALRRGFQPGQGQFVPGRTKRASPGTVPQA